MKKLLSELKDPEFRGLLALVLLFVMIGTLSYMIIEDWDIVDAFYFSVVTLTTTGYGDVAPATHAGKLFTVGYLITGLGLMFAFIRKLAENTIKRKPLKGVMKSFRGRR